jgi:hypothetical protein
MVAQDLGLKPEFELTNVHGVLAPNGAEQKKTKIE